MLLFGAAGGGLALSRLLVRWRRPRAGLGVALLSVGGLVAAVVITVCSAAPFLTAVSTACFTFAYRARLRVWLGKLQWFGGVVAVKISEWTSAPDLAADMLCLEAARETRAVVLEEAMVCKECRTDIFGTADLIRERFQHTAETRDCWYPHEMDFLSAEDVPTYGGMKDPTGQVESYVVRVRCGPAVLNKLVRQHDPDGGGASPPTRLNTWFPPHKWSTIYCRRCNQDGDPFRMLPPTSIGGEPRTLWNIGWLFTPPPGSNLEPFLGLKVLELRERHAGS